MPRRAGALCANLIGKNKKGRGIPPRPRA